MTRNTSSSDLSTNPVFMLLFGGLFACVGGFFVLVALGILPSPPEAFAVPRGVVALAGAMFMFAGMMIILRGVFSPAAQQTALYQWLQYIATLGMLGSFSAVFTWVGLGPGEREFSGSASIGPIAFFTGDASALMGRCLFGGFGLFIALATVWYAVVAPLRILGVWPSRTEEEDL